MHILFLHQYYSPEGGSGNDRTRQFAQYFVKAGHRVSVITSAARFEDIPEIQKVYKYTEQGVELTVLPYPDPHMLNYVSRIQVYLSFMRDAIQEAQNLGGLDVIYACSTPLSVGEAGRKLSKILNAPWVFEIQDVWPDAAYGMGIIRNSILRSILDRLTRRIYEAASALIVLSEDMQAQVNRLGNYTHKTTVIPNGTDVDLFYVQEKRPSDIVRFVYAGSIGRANGIDQLVSAVHILNQRNVKGIRIEIIGQGNRYSEVRKAAKGLEEYLCWTPQVSKKEAAEKIRNADVGIVCFAPYKVLEANSANKFFDYLSAGIPVLINYGGWQKKLIEAHQCGFSAERGRAEDLAEKMIQLAQDATLRREMGTRARALSMQYFDRKKLAAQALEILQSVAGKK